MINVHEREMEYQAIRKFVKALDDPRDRLSRNLAAAVAEELTEKQREAVTLYFLKQMTMTDIAARQGVCVSSVSRNISRAKKRLRRCLRYGAMALLDSRGE